MVRSRRSTRRRRGGKLVSQGSYGCGFYPPLRCSNNSMADPAFFSKVMVDGDAVKEMEEVTRVRELDPDYAYSLYPARLCDLHPNNVAEKAENFADCKLLDPEENIRNTFRDFRVLQIPRGERDLFQHLTQVLITKTIRAHRALFGGLRNLIVGMVHFHRNGLYHMDIKLQNTVIDTDLVCRYIDFGLSTTGKVNSVYLQPYFVYPVELQFLGLNFERAQTYLHEGVLQAHIDSFYKVRLHHQTPYDSLYNDLGLRRITVDFMKTVLFPTLKGKPATYFFEKTDIFALGQMFAQVFLRTQGILVKRGEPQQLLTTGGSRRLPPFHPFLPFYEQVYQLLQKLVLDMTDPMPDVRPDANTLLSRYDAFLSAYDAFLVSRGTAAAPQEVTPAPSLLGKRPRGNSPDGGPAEEPSFLRNM